MGNSPSQTPTPDSSVTSQTPSPLVNKSSHNKDTSFATYTCRALSNSTPLELQASNVQSAHGQKYIYFSLSKATLQQFRTIICTSVGGELPVGNVFSLNKLAYSGHKCDAKGTYVEYQCETDLNNESVVHRNLANKGVLMARLRTRSASDNEPNRADTLNTSHNWTIVWTYCVTS
jgi:hypothetical protein